MKAICLVKYGDANTSFQIREVEMPKPKDHEVLIKVETSGLNFADVMARKGFYKDAPALPAVLGYEVSGRVEAFGKNVTNLKKNDRVMAFTRFGGYAEYTIADHRAVALIPEKMGNDEAAALTTQYCTAFYAACLAANIQKGETVLIHAAAGGVGLALIQLAKAKECIIFGTAGSQEKIEFLKNAGVHFPINYRETDFVQEVLKQNENSKIDVVFDPIGGKSFKRSKSLIAAGGRVVTFGASSQLEGKKGVINSLKTLFGFGFYTPVELLMKSTSVIGVNMLRIADQKPEVLQFVLEKVISLYNKGLLSPHIGASFPAENIHDAHQLLESRKSMGKIVINW